MWHVTRWPAGPGALQARDDLLLLCSSVFLAFEGSTEVTGGLLCGKTWAEARCGDSEALLER